MSLREASALLALLATLSACGDSSSSDGADGSGGAGGGSGNGPSATNGAGPTAAAGTSSSSGGLELLTYGDVYEGGEFHLGPVDYEETEWHNACAPGTGYIPAVREVQGTMLAGIWGGLPEVASHCDACIWVETAQGKSALLRVVTYGDTTPNSIDVSPEAYAVLDSGEYPRLMTWQFARCPDTGPMIYEFQTGSSEWWTSLWVRNARVPLVRVEVESANHGFVELERGGDGTLTDAGGFGLGPFTIRSTGMDGQQVVQTFEWPGDIAGAVLTGDGNFE